MWVLYLICFIVFFYAIGAVYSYFNKQSGRVLENFNKLEGLKDELEKRKKLYEDHLQEKEKEFISKKEELELKISKDEERLSKLEQGLDEEINKKQVELARQQGKNIEIIQQLAKEKSQGFPWLAEAYSDYFCLQNLKEAKYLERKFHPAPVSAERIREIAWERRTIEKKLRIAQGIIKYYQSLFPFLEDWLDERQDELLRLVLTKNVEEPIEKTEAYWEEGIDPVMMHLEKEEYKKLSLTERNQLALNRYWAKQKNRIEAGRAYERYIGYLYESDGWSVYYQGILEGKEDLGRDLIGKKKRATAVIQCKRWSPFKHKIIHENHINQLFGTSIKYRIEHPNENIVPKLYTTTIVSDKAKEFAEALGVKLYENTPFKSYPSIKCNVSRRNGEKIYHLPFDQQYDRTLIEEERNECYVETVAEAEKLGYRRAFRWKGRTEEK